MIKAKEREEAEKKAVVAGGGSSAVLALEPLHISELFSAYSLCKKKTNYIHNSTELES